MVHINQRKVCEITFSYIAAVNDVEAGGRSMTHFLHHFFQCYPSLLYIMKHHQQRMLYKWKSRVRLFITFVFFFPGVWRVIGRNDVEPVVEQGIPKRFFVIIRLYGWIALDQVTQRF